MPIRKDLRRHYGREWKALSLRLRSERAGDCCEGCGARNGRPHPLTGKVVVLTCAHIDHDATHMDEARLRVWCALCHNRHDAAHRAANRRRTRNLRLGTRDLFDHPPPGSDRPHDAGEADIR